jgi:pimeloyl-ACP methyl ester carboxylesterase
MPKLIRIQFVALAKKAGRLVAASPNMRQKTRPGRNARKPTGGGATRATNGTQGEDGMAFLGYDTFGKGPPKIIALHGWFGDEKTFAPIYRALDPDAFTWIVPAYRGYGASKHITGEYTVFEIAKDVVALADSLKIDRFSLVGHSMGGMAIQRVLADAPARVEKLIAITPVPASGVPFDDATYAMFESAVSNPDAARGIVGFSVGGRLCKRFINDVALYPKKVALDAAFSGYLKSWVRTDFHAEIAGKTLPVKVIVGEHDGGLTADIMKATYLTYYPNAELEVMANSGHYPMDETPIALATSIEEFLNR